MLLGAAVSVLALFAISTIDRVVASLYIDLASYIAVALAGAAGTNSLFWIVRAARLAVLISSFRNTKLIWYAPARTSGIEALSRWYRIVTGWLAVGVAILFAPVIEVSNHVPGSSLFTAVKWVFALLALSSIGAFGVFSQWRLSVAIVQKRMSALHSLSKKLPSRPPGPADVVTEEHARLYDLFNQVSETPVGVIDSQTVASTILAIFAGALPVIVSMLVN